MSLFSGKGSHQSVGDDDAKAGLSRKAYSRRLEKNLGHPQKMEKKKRIWSLAGILVGTLVLLVLIGLIAFRIWAKAPETDNAALKVQATPAPSAQTASADAATETTPTPQPTPAETPLRNEDMYTVLVVGRDQVGLNTDTIMVVRMDCKNHTANVVSIPRDTLVDVPWSVKKVNSIYGACGAEGLLDGIGDILGFTVDNYVIVNTDVFRQVIDCIGGVYYNVPMYMFYDDPEQYLHISLAPGYQLLNGYQCEQLVRFRQNNDGSGYPDGDIGRINLQHDFFLTLAKQMLSLGNIANLSEIVDLVVSSTDTDLTSGNLAFYAQEFLKMDSDSIRFLTIPCENVNILGGSYVSIYLYEWLDMVNEELSPFNIPVTTENMDILTYDGYGFSSTAGVSPGYGSFYDFSAATP